MNSDHDRLATSSQGTKLVCGCGYLGERVAKQWVAAGDKVWATTRSVTRAATLSQLGLHPVVVDITQPFSFPEDLPSFDTVIWAVGFDHSAGQSIQDVYVTGLRNLLAALRTDVNRFILISSTGVYGQSHGEWIDERSACEPTRPGGMACLAAESLMAQHALGKRRIILRLAGIYGPERLPKLASLLAGKKIDSPESGYLNLIYVDDAIQVILAAERRALPPAMFIVSDGKPVLRGDFYRELARLLNVPAPDFEEPLAGSATAERSRGDKRVRNDHMLNTLEVSLRFSSFREGLATIVAQR